MKIECEFIYVCFVQYNGVGFVYLVYCVGVSGGLIVLECQCIIGGGYLFCIEVVFGQNWYVVQWVINVGDCEVEIFFSGVDDCFWVDCYYVVQFGGGVGVVIGFDMVNVILNYFFIGNVIGFQRGMQIGDG